MACTSTRESTIERPCRRGSRSKSFYTGLACKKELEARRDNGTHCSGKLPTRPVGLVPAFAEDPASTIMKYIRMGKDVLLDIEEHICKLESDATRVALMT